MNRVAFLAMCVLALGTASASMWYVDSSVPASGDGQSWETAFHAIQEGIDAASSGDTVTVAEGLYVENIHFNGKNIVLTSTDPLDSDVVASTIIDGNDLGSVVTFSGTEDETCVLAGFTIRNGRNPTGGGIYGGAWSTPTHATIQNNLITSNVAASHGYGGGLAHCSGTVQNNVISYNGALRGGGLYACHGIIRRNTIQGNSVTGYFYGVGEPPSPEWEEGRGGGLFDCDGTIEGNTIGMNLAREQKAKGGGLAECDGAILNNAICDNSATGERAAGGGLYNCHALIHGNNITGNSATGFYSHGGGLYGCNGTIQNNRIMANSASNSGGGLIGGGIIQNNCIVGNSAKSAGGLASGGTIVNNTIAGNSADDYGGGLSCSGPILNCIIWGNTAGTSGSQLYGSGQPFFCCIQYGTGRAGNIASAPQFVDPANGDYRLREGSPCIDAGSYYWTTWPQRDLDGNCRLSGAGPDMGCYEHGSFPDNDGDLLSDEQESAAKTDPGLDDTDGDAIRDGLEVLRGSDPLQTTLPGLIHVPLQVSTIQAALLVSIDDDEIIVSPGTYLENLRFLGRNLTLRSSFPHSAHAVWATTIDGRGGTVICFTGHETEACVLSGFTIQNGRGEDGAGICGGNLDDHTNATIQNNRITTNFAGDDGGAIVYCDGIIRNNTIVDNSAGGNGGGFFDCDGVLENNLVARNSSRDGGGFSSCDGTLRNNSVIANSATRSGGGLSGCHGAIYNCIIWGNTAGISGSQLCGSSEPLCSCIQDGTALAGNIAQYPRFVNAQNGNFRLLPDSPCIDAGFNDPELPETDIAGMHRIMYGGKSLTVDMGAYEFHIWPPSLDSPMAEVTLKWSSLTGKTYSVYRSSDMLTWELAGDSIPSMGDTFTTWLDPTVVSPSPDVRVRFYRIIENE